MNSMNPRATIQARKRVVGPQGPVQVLIERDIDNPLVASTGRQAFWSAFFTFNLAIMGSSVLPMPYAVSRTGALVGPATMLLVAACNTYTARLMVSSAYETGLDSYESLALWAGGPGWRRFTQIALIALLWGPNSGALSIMADVFQVMGERIWGAAAAAAAASAAAGSSSSSSGLTSGLAHAFTALLPADSGGFLSSHGLGWLISGQTAMVVMTVCAVYPLSSRKHMRSLESAAGAGFLVVVGLAGWLAYKAAAAGLPAIADGQLPLASPKLFESLPEAFSLLGYAFYLQPLMMPMIREMPEGPAGRNALTAAVYTAMGSSLLLYALTGFFGACLFGLSTDGNVMVNNLTDNTWGCLAMYTIMLLYLAAGASAAQYPLRASVDLLLVGERVPMTRARSMLINAVTLGASLLMALVTPGGAEKVYAVVGATCVCIVCYALPVAIHLKLLYAKHQETKPQLSAAPSADVEQQLTAALLSPHSSASSLTDLAAAAAGTAGAAAAAGLPAPAQQALLRGDSSFADRLQQQRQRRWQLMRQAALPLAVMALGIGFSVAAFYVAVLDILEDG